MFQTVHESLCEIKGEKNKPFGNCSIVTCGDLYQLKPVGDNWVFKGASLHGRPANCAPNHWKILFKNYHLTETMRNKTDYEFKKYCQNIKTGFVDQKTINYFQQMPNCCIEEDSNENFQNGSISIIVNTNAKASEVNVEKMEKLEKAKIGRLSHTLDCNVHYNIVQYTTQYNTVQYNTRQ